MREIKFRAYIKKSDKMVNVTVIRLEGWMIGEDGNSYNKDEYVLMQYVGLKDKDVYEDDIVKCSISKTQSYKGIIKFEEGCFFIQAFWYSFKPMGRWDLQEKPLCGKSTDIIDINCEMEVIGNIHENPKLMETK